MTTEVSFCSTRHNSSFYCPIDLSSENHSDGWVIHKACDSKGERNIDHIFHKHCLKQAILADKKEKPGCPICRAPIKLETLFSKEEIEHLKQSKKNKNVTLWDRIALGLLRANFAHQNVPGALTMTWFLYLRFR